MVLLEYTYVYTRVRTRVSVQGDPLAREPGQSKDNRGHGPRPVTPQCKRATATRCIRDVDPYVDCAVPVKRQDRRMDGPNTRVAR
jgi:hypothetical protein